MSVFPKKTKDGRWQHDFRVGDENSPRKRGIFDTKVEAHRFERLEKAKFEGGSFEKKSNQDKRTLLEFIEDWYRLHGSQLRYNEGTKRKLVALAMRLNNPITRTLTAKHFTEDRVIRLSEGIKVNSVNNDLAYVKAMFNEMIRLGYWKYENPVKPVKKIKSDDIELAFLDLEQVDHLLYDIEANGRNPDTLLVTKICLATGARWNEAEKLTPGQVLNNRVTYYASLTKGRRHRTVPIPCELTKEIRARAKGLSSTERIFKYCYSAFRASVVKRCKFSLPDGQMAHVLRHTFASHFIMNYGNLLSLQKILGHVDIKTTMRYAHLAPDYLEEAIRKNPLSLLTEKRNKASTRN